MIEMVLTLMIISIVAAVGSVSMGGGFNAYLTARAIEPLAMGGRLALERLRKELMGAQTCTGISQPGGHGSIQFMNDQGRVVLVNQGASSTNALFMTFNGDGQEWILAPDVEANSLDFKITPCSGGLTPGLVTISFAMSTRNTDGSTIRLPLKTSVYVRSTSQ
ncbi:MAG: hypothetical protein HQL93_14055 [Magnetococcales bacterium]|nr:hypothetical protein [Magnetococcales bacterium]